MSRARSKTVDTVEVKKNGIPRRLNEKIALMKKKEQAQSQAFEQAMQSIFEMQQAQLHGGGGSMPSLQNIDSSVPPNSTLQVSPPYPPLCNNTNNSGCLTTPPTGHQQRERPLSGGIVTNRNHPPVERTLSCDVEGNSRLSSNHHHHMSDNMSWNNVHKSESDLQQSLVDHMTALQTPPPFMQHQTPPTIMTSSSSNSHNGYHPSDQGIGNLKNKEFWQSFPTSPQFSNKASPNHGGTTSLLSPDHTVSSNSGGNGMTSNIDPGLIGSASSLPDLTNIEFSSGLDVPIERDDDSPTMNKVNPFHFPSPGPSKLALSSMAAAPLGSPTSYGFTPTGTTDIRSHPYYHGHHGGGGMVPRSPTMPEFRQHKQLSAPPVRKFKNSHHHGYQTPPSYNNSDSVMSPTGGDGMYQPRSSQSVPPPQYNGSRGPPYCSPAFIPQSSSTVHHGVTASSSPFNDGNSSTVNSFQNTQQQTSFNTIDNSFLPGLQIDNSVLLGMEQSQAQQLPNSPVKPPSLASTTSSGYVSLSAYLDPGITYQQKALQQRLANISVSKDNAPLRSHSEENLMKMQKEVSKNEGIMQQNPFMGNMSNASSVPCVYVESNTVDSCVEEYESYTTGTGSPSTSASHASSPPIHRSEWLDHPAQTINEFVFQDWPLESNAVLSDRVKLGSPLSHHKSLNELNKIGDYINMDLSPTSSSRAHQLSLPSIVMGDLIALDDHNMEKQGSGPFLPDDFDMEDDVVDSILRNDDFSSFDVNMMGGASMMTNANNHVMSNNSHVMMDSTDLYQHSNNPLNY